MQSQKQTKNIQIFLLVGWLVGEGKLFFRPKLLMKPETRINQY